MTIIRAGNERELADATGAIVIDPRTVKLTANGRTISLEEFCLQAKQLVFLSALTKRDAANSVVLKSENRPTEVLHTHTVAIKPRGVC